jgi:pantetheine-phosphate adenylyltransferase
MRVGLFPGSFDPFHNGHLEIVERASKLFDKVVVAAVRNPQKGAALFDLEERQELLVEATAHIPSVEVISMATLTVWVARDVGADAIIRGLRAVS